MGWRWLVISFTAISLQGVAPVQAWQDWPGDWSPGRPSLAASSEAEPYLITAQVFRLDVPFRTQKDGSRWQSSNCGPATLGMVLDAFGVVGQATDDLRFRSHSYQGTVGIRTGTALQHIAHVAEDFGIPTVGLYNDASLFNNWSLNDIRGQLRLGRPVMPLVRLYMLPGYENSLPRWGHYILLTGTSDNDFFYNDALQIDAASGSARIISAEQLERAMQFSHIPGQAVAFGGPGLAHLAVWTP